MLKIRLKRAGKKHAPHYKIIVIPARTKRDGRAVEYIGYHNPISKETKVDLERAKYWLSVGAQPTGTVHSILAKHKLLEPLPRPDREPLKPKKETEKSKEEKKTVPQEKKKEEKKDIEQKPKEQKPETEKPVSIGKKSAKQEDKVEKKKEKVVKEPKKESKN